MKISIIHPTRGRKQMAFDTAYKWLSNADNLEDISYFFSVDSDDKDLWFASVRFAPNNCTTDNLFTADVIKNDNKSAIEAINFAASYIYQRNRDADYITIVVSDDFSCPEHWDTLLLDALKGKSDFIVKTQDGIQKTLITLPIMDRVYYERFGYVYHPDYLHMHADEEMTIVGHMLGRVIDLPLVFPHNHYTVGGMQMDAINAKNNATWAHGASTLERRAKDNFGIEKPLVRREDIVWR